MSSTRNKETSQSRKSTIIGLALTIVVHIAAICFVSLSGFKYIYPPPQEKSILLDFIIEEFENIENQSGREPQSETVNVDEPIRLAQQSESPIEGSTPNETTQSQQDNFGDIETPSPKIEEPKLDPRASFPGMAKKDTSITAAHNATEATDSFKAGQSDGNTAHGRTDGRPNAQVKGRKTIGNIPNPLYNVQESGIVVVNIWVDNYGNVVKAVPGGDGTTVLDKSLYAAARKAAMETHFNMNADAPAMQEGTITYYFNLK